MFEIAALKLLLGPLLGFFGTIWTSYSARKDKILEFQERALERAHELKAMELENELALKKQVAQSDADQKIADMDAFAKSYEFANKPMLAEGTKLTGWHKSVAVLMDSITVAIRPGMTIFYQVLVFGLMVYFAYQMNKAGVSMLDTEFVSSMFKDIIYTIITLAETMALWWFGIRMLSTRGKTK